MMPYTETPFMMLPLREATVAQLMALRAEVDEPLDHVVARLAALETPVGRSTPQDPPSEGPSENRAGCWKHGAEVLGEKVTAQSLGRLFAHVIDLIEEIDAGLLDRLAEARARTRRHISRTQSAIHPGRPDLRTIRTRSGWWVSANVGEDDVRRSLIALCRAGGLTFGEDVRFPSPRADLNR
jgi:hypothetical protein